MPLCVDLGGNRKSKKAIVIAIVPSSIKSGTEKIEDHPEIFTKPRFKSVRNIHNIEVMPKTTAIIFSGKENLPSDLYSFAIKSLPILISKTYFQNLQPL